jgi:hypothetical protein
MFSAITGGVTVGVVVGGIFLLATMAPPQPRNPAKEDDAQLCYAYAEWKRVAHDEAPGMEKLCQPEIGRTDH